MDKDNRKKIISGVILTTLFVSFVIVFISFNLNKEMENETNTLVRLRFLVYYEDGTNIESSVSGEYGVYDKNGSLIEDNVFYHTLQYYPWVSLVGHTNKYYSYAFEDREIKFEFSGLGDRIVSEEDIVWVDFESRINGKYYKDIHDGVVIEIQATEDLGSGPSDTEW